MKIQYISDVHLELIFPNYIKYLTYLIKPKAEICVLAGDIGNPFEKKYKNFLLNINNKFEKTFIIAGNHEYYNNEIIDAKNKIQSICDELPNVSFLDNSFEDYKGYRFIGFTLWSKITDKRYTINDVSKIKNFSIREYNLLHHNCVNFFNETLAISADKKVIVITHHLPIYELTDIKYRNCLYHNYHQWFNANINNTVINNKSICAWIYGHTHTASIQNHYNINFYCNPIGYFGENKLGDINKIFEAP
jgi:predicted phosphodiesterase